MKPIETHYRGYRFRSRLEARHAVFLDYFREPWDYEPEGFNLPSGQYLPDFWLSRLGCWLEIKGQKPTEREQQLCYELAHATGKPVAIAWGLPFPAWRNYRIERRDVLNDVDDPAGGEHEATFLIWDRSFITDRLTVFCQDFGGDSGGEVWFDSFWATDATGKLCFCSNDDRDEHKYYSFGDGYEAFDGMKHLDEIWGPITELKVGVAKSARFEHGETPTYYSR